MRYIKGMSKDLPKSEKSSESPKRKFIITINADFSVNIQSADLQLNVGDILSLNVNGGVKGYTVVSIGVVGNETHINTEEVKKSLTEQEIVGDPEIDSNRDLTNPSMLSIRERTSGDTSGGGVFVTGSLAPNVPSRIDDVIEDSSGNSFTVTGGTKASRIRRLLRDNPISIAEDLSLGASNLPYTPDMVEDLVEHMIGDLHGEASKSEDKGS